MGETGGIRICRAANPAEYLPKIDREEADAEFLFAIAENDERMQAILCENVPVGLAQLRYGSRAYLYVYIFPEFRRRGYGRAAAALLEAELHAPQLRWIMTCYRSDDPGACAFAERRGYAYKYASDCLVYRGPLFSIGEVPVRQYQDGDYEEAHAMYAEAFHVMRVSTGCFPESVPEPPSEGMRKYWAETADERLVYLLNGEIVGYAHIEGAEIGSISVKTSHQGRGIGEKFVKYVINKLLMDGHKEVSLYCVVGNHRARRLYDRIGCEEVCRNAYAIKWNK